MGRRLLVLFLATVLFLGGAAVAVAGGALMLVFGSDSTLSSGQAQLATPTAALVASMNDIQDTKGVASAVGTPKLRLSVTGSGSAVFIGIGPAQAVERYLARSRIDRVTDLEVDPFALKTVRRDGSSAPGAPGQQSFWTARASGPSASLNWAVKDGSYRLVVMNADASEGVQASGEVGLAVPHLFAIGLAILIGGALVAIIGLILLIVGARMRVYRQPAMK